MLAFAFLILFTFSSASVSALQLNSFPKVTTIQMSTEEIYEHWTTQPFASVLSLFLQDMHLNKDQLGMMPDQFNKCYFGAQTVPRMAKCIVRLLNNEFQIGLKNAKIIDGTKNMAKSEKWVGEIRVESESDEESGHESSSGEKESVNGPSKTGYYSAMPSFEFAKVRKREAIFAVNQRHFNKGFLARKRQNTAISKSHSYNLMEAKRTFGLSPIGGFARFLMSGILGKKNKTQTIPWQETISKIQKAKKAHNQLKKEEKKWRDYVLKQMTVNSADETTAYGSKVHKLNEQIAKMVNDGIKVGMRLAAFQRKSKSIEHSKSDEFNEGKSDEMANYDEGIDGEEYGSEQSEEYGKSGERGSSGREASRAKATEAGRLVDILSPRFMSLTASKSRRKDNFLSPSLLSLHTKGHGIERKMSLPNLMKEGTHLLDRDQNEWLNLIMEASGVNDQVDTVKHLLSSADDGHDATDEEMAKKVEKRYKRDFNGLYLTKENAREMYGQNEQRKSDIWDKLVQTLSKEQLTAMNRSGIVSMNAEQLRLIYGPARFSTTRQHCGTY